jgi:DNA-directed RNA polymerase subunit RPC12/RpoP
MAGSDAGEQVQCPGCGLTVLQKAMIPVLGDGGGVQYLCVACARLLVVKASEDGRGSAEEASEEASEDASDAGGPRPSAADGADRSEVASP